MCDFGISAGVSAGIMAAIKIIGVIGAIASTTISTVSAVKTSNANEKMSEYQARVAQDNAKIAEENARNERQSGLEEARRQRIKTIQTIGAQQTAMAANGIDIASGSALDTVSDTAQTGELDALMLQYNAERQAYNYEVGANNYTNQANLHMFEAKNAKTAGTLNAIGGVAKSIGDVGMKIDTKAISDKWNNWKASNKGQMTGFIPSTQRGYAGSLPALK